MLNNGNYQVRRFDGVLAGVDFMLSTSVPLIYFLASLFYAAEFPVLLSEISSRSMAHFAAVMSGDFRVALSVAACGFILFGLVAAVAGLGKRSAGGKETPA